MSVMELLGQPSYIRILKNFIQKNSKKNVVRVMATLNLAIPLFIFYYIHSEV